MWTFDMLYFRKPGVVLRGVTEARSRRIRAPMPYPLGYALCCESLYWVGCAGPCRGPYFLVAEQESKQRSRPGGGAELLSPDPKAALPLDLLLARIFVSAGLGFGILLVRCLWGGVCPYIGWKREVWVASSLRSWR